MGTDPLGAEEILTGLAEARRCPPEARAGLPPHHHRLRSRARRRHHRRRLRPLTSCGSDVVEIALEVRGTGTERFGQSSSGGSPGPAGGSRCGEWQTRAVAGTGPRRRAIRRSCCGPPCPQERTKFGRSPMSSTGHCHAELRAVPGGFTRPSIRRRMAIRLILRG